MLPNTPDTIIITRYSKYFNLNLLSSSVIIKKNIDIIKDIFIPSSHPFFSEFLPILNPPKNIEIIGINSFIIFIIL